MSLAMLDGARRRNHGQVTRPAIELIGFARVDLEPGQQHTMTFAAHADGLSFTGLRGQRVVEPWVVRFSTGRSSGDLPLEADVEVVGDLRSLRGARAMQTRALRLGDVEAD